MPVVSKVIEITDVWKNGIPINEASLISNFEFKNALVINIMLRKEMLRLYKALKLKVENCINRIGNELKK
jgi:hypothetical protein